MRLDGRRFWKADIAPPLAFYADLLSLSLSLSSSKTTRSFDEIYTLLVKDCEIKLSTTKREPKSAGQVNPQQSTETLKADMVKLICQDAKIGGPRA